MKFESKIFIPVSSANKKFLTKKANQSRQTVSGFVRSRLFDRTDLRGKNKLFNFWLPGRTPFNRGVNEGD